MDLRYQLRIGRLGKIICLHINHRLPTSFIIITKRYKTIDPRIFRRIHQILKLLIKRFASILVRLHSILNFVFTFLSSIKLLDSNQIKRIGYQITFDF